MTAPVARRADADLRAGGAWPAPGGRVGLGTAYGSFGELLQGALPRRAQAPGDGHFLVTLPVARWSTARFTRGRPGTGTSVRPGGKTKASRFAARLLAELGLPPDGTLVLHNTLPEGKGLASSSADLVATARAVLAATNRRLSRERLGVLLADTEPTDGVLYPGVVAFDHLRGRYLHSLGRLPALQVVALDQGGRVDTVAFNRTTGDFDADERRRYARLLARLTVAVRHGDLLGVGRVATESAELNQRRAPKAAFAALRAVCREVGGLGVVACHSGTMVGLLLDPRAAGYRARLSAAVRHAAELPGSVHLYRTLAC